MTESNPFGYARSRISRDGVAPECPLCGDSRSAAIELPVCARCAFQIYDAIAPLFGAPRRPNTPPLRAERTGHVYYIRRGDLIKIGFTIQLAERMQALLPDEVLAVEPGTMRLERERQRQFAEWRYAGGFGPAEWFFDVPPLRDHIARVLLEHGQPPALPTLTAPRVSRSA